MRVIHVENVDWSRLEVEINKCICDLDENEEIVDIKYNMRTYAGHVKQHGHLYTSTHYASIIVKKVR